MPHTFSRRQALSLISGGFAACAMCPGLALAEPKTMIFNWNRQFAPYSMMKDGRISGILVDAMNDIVGKRMGFAVEHRAYDWPVAQDLIRAAKGDALCTNPTDGRKQFMLFAEESVIESLASVFWNRDNPRSEEIRAISSVNDLNRFTMVDYQGNGWARRTFPPSLRVNWLPDMDTVFTTILDGDADIFVGNGFAALYAMQELGIRDRFAARELAVGEPSCFNFGLRRTFPEAEQVVRDFEAALDEAQLDNTIRAIIDKYL
ncbi:substrate-binding periplasmic protein [Pseudodesulfovibrio tunisiensis]|uniref:substrate-binding periplasmic protein n=1 Tax=Pseudodesulfovibrio tunisiensis TaxID=463192 RepID=UPI001FB2B0DB|nr:transporter substrate-binding domain-containing protein [Pseudodesulfovibrio tunisiensis]